jgi:RimJ/RimL family protein N-acetyltransferase
MLTLSEPLASSRAALSSAHSWSRRQMEMKIETSRLTLTRACRVDFEDCRRYWSEPGIPWANGVNPDLESSWSRLLRNEGHWSMLGFGLWIIREKRTWNMIGEVGFCEAYREVIPPLPQGAEFGIALTPSARGMGFAFEAATAALSSCDSLWHEQHTVCMISSTNTPALQLVGKLGYRQDGSAVYRGEPIVFMRRRRPNTIPCS